MIRAYLPSMWICQPADTKTFVVAVIVASP